MGIRILTWAQEQRVNWIGEMLKIYGFINRHHIMCKFRVSMPQAAADLKLFQQLSPDAAIYDASAKTYRSANPWVAAYSFERVK